jgi:hypothetical protein
MRVSPEIFLLLSFLVGPKVYASAETLGKKNSKMTFRVTAFSNMETGWQITNPGTRYLLKSGGTPVMGGALGMSDAVTGKKFAASGSASGPALELSPAPEYINEGFVGTKAEGTELDGTISICLAKDQSSSAFDTLTCRSIKASVPREHDDRNNQFIDVPVRFKIEGLSVRITSWGNGDRRFIGREGSMEAPSASVYHPVYQAQKPGGAVKDNRSPLVLDMNGSKTADLIGVWEDGAVAFDLEGDGKKNLTGWVQPVDALLAIDRDGDGKIGDGRELFGDFSWADVLEKNVRRRFPNGFAALAQYDSNQDGSFDRNDPAFKYVKLWFDRNSDGISQAAELVALDTKVQSISLAYTRNTQRGKTVVIKGNDVPFISTFKLINGETHLIADVYFNQDRDSDVATVK